MAGSQTYLTLEGVIRCISETFSGIKPEAIVNANSTITATFRAGGNTLGRISVSLYEEPSIRYDGALFGSSQFDFVGEEGLRRALTSIRDHAASNARSFLAMCGPHLV